MEDSEQVSDLSYAILNRQGYTVLVAENSAEALRVLELHNGPVDFLLTDVVMPDMNGRDLFAKVAEKCSNILLYMSDYTDNVIAHHGETFADNRRLRKLPFFKGLMVCWIRGCSSFKNPSMCML